MGIAIPQVVTSDRASGAQFIDGSLKFDKDKLTYLSRTPSSSGNRNNWTISCWLKRDSLDDNQRFFESGNTAIRFGASNFQWIDGGSGNNGENTPAAKLRDTNGWYHCIFAWDSSAGVLGNRIYVNGVELAYNQTGGGNPSGDSAWNTGSVIHTIGQNGGNGSRYYGGRMSQVYFIDGQTLTPESFGYTDLLTNTWRPKKYTGNLKSSSSTIPDAFTYWTGMDQNWSSGGSTSAGNDYINQALPSSGKVYWEVTLNSPDTYRQIGIAQGASGTGTGYNDNIFGFYYNGNPPIWLVKNSSGTARGGAVTHGLGTGTNWNNGDKLMFAWDADNDKIWFGLNGTWYAGGDPANGTNPTISGEDLSANSHYFKQGRTDSNNTTTLTNITSGSASYFSALNTVYVNTNTFYLPMDGNSPIGEDKSGNGNNWTPVNFGGSVALDNPIVSGALPILNTDGGGNVARVGVRTDANAANLVLALPLVGTADDVSNSINSGSTTKTIANNGVNISNANSNFYGGSHYWDGGTTDRLTVTYNSEFQFGTGDFCVEFWVNMSDLSSNHYFFDFDQNGGILQYQGGQLSYSDGVVAGSGPLYSTGITLSVGKWHHLAVTRESSTAKIFVDGVMRATGTTAYNYNQTSVLDIGNGYNNSGYEITGYMQDFRIYKGVAKYTSDFVVPSTSPDILPDTPSGVSGSSKLAKVTDGAVSFDGTGDYLSLASDVDLQMGTGDFTIECYFNIDGATPTSCWRCIISLGGFTTAGGITIYAPRESTPADTVVVILNAVNPTMSSTINIKKGWHHVALVRNSGTTKLYVNGIEQSSLSDTTNYNYSGTVYIGKDDNCNPNTHYQGFISNLRIVKGTALYTTDFTPPTRALTNVTNTKLLCCQSNTSATAAAVQPSATSYFTGGTALTWDSSPIGSKWTLSNSNKNATSSGGSGYTGGNVWSNVISANTTVAWTLDVTNGDTTGGWYFTDSQSATATHPDQLGGNTLGLRGNVTSAGYYGTFASANGGSNGQNKISMNSDVSPNGAKSIDFVVYRPSSGTGKVWVKANDTSTWIGGGNPSDTSSTATFIIPDGTTYFGFIDYDSGDTTNCNMRGDGDITGPLLSANGEAAATNFNPFTTDINAVRGQESGYATFNPISGNGSSGQFTFTDGNLTATTTNSNKSVTCNIGMSTGKWYCEYSVLQTPDFHDIGISYLIDPPAGFDDGTLSASWRTSTGQIRQGNTDVQATGMSASVGDIVQIVFDADARKMWIGVNGFYSNGGNPAAGTNSTYQTNLTADEYFFAVSMHGSGTSSGTINFGQKPFKFPPPDGFQPLNAANVRPETVIARPDQYVGTSLYTGNGGTLSVINLNFKPDLVWIKCRSHADDHTLTDSVRGADRALYSNNANQENVSSIRLQSFNNDGFTIGSSGDTNTSGRTFCAWTWKAGGNKNTFNVDDVGYASASDVNMSVGTFNSTLYNQTQTWSNNWTGGFYAAAYGATKIFDGNLSTWASVTYPGSSGVTLAVSPAISGSTIRVYYSRSNATTPCSVNGTETLPSTGSSNTYQWHTLSATSISSFTLTHDNSGSSYLAAIEVDGKMLVDSGVTPPNVPSIAPTGCSVGTRQGFSIIKYQANLTQGATIAHGLTQKPDFALFKNLDSTLGDNEVDWGVYHSSIGATQRLELNQNIAAAAFPGPFNDTEPTSSIFTFGGGSQGHSYLTNGPSGDDFIGYIWHDVPGLQKFGKWQGNSSADGPFIETGFRPAVILYKDITSTGYWNIRDSSRTTYNGATNELYPAGNEIENHHNSNRPIDFLSNGFKIRINNDAINNSSRQYMYAAWAEAPAFNLYGAQSNAR